MIPLELWASRSDMGMRAKRFGLRFVVDEEAWKEAGSRMTYPYIPGGPYPYSLVDDKTEEEVCRHNAIEGIVEYLNWRLKEHGTM